MYTRPTFISQVLKYCKKRGYIEENNLEGFEFGKRDIKYDTTHLSQEEVERLYEFDFTALPIQPKTAKALDEERDVFVFCCYTGQHYCDFQKKGLEFFTGIDGRFWLRDARTKTGSPYQIPMHNTVQEILNKYGSLEAMPNHSNYNRNMRLKQIATFLGFNLILSTKIARKTLTNYLLNDLAVREEVVASVLGHSNTKTLKHYGRISEKSIAREVQFEQKTPKINSYTHSSNIIPLWKN